MARLPGLAFVPSSTSLQLHTPSSIERQSTSSRTKMAVKKRKAALEHEEKSEKKACIIALSCRSRIKLTNAEQRRTGESTTTSTSSGITPEITTASAAEKVFNTFELLEAVTVHLPAREIFAIQSVSHCFRSVIASSLPIHKRLFIRTCASKELWDLCSTSPSPRPSPDCDDHIYWQPHHPTNRDCIGQQFVPTRLCPFLKVPQKHWADLSLRTSAFRRAMLRWTVTGKAARAQGLWRDVQLTDPPCEEVTQYHVSSRITAHSVRRDASFGRAKLEVQGGITLGDVVDAACTTPASLVVDACSREDAHLSGGRFYIDQLRDLIKDEQGRHYEKSPLYVEIRLSGMVIPTEEEWTSVRKYGISC